MPESLLPVLHAVRKTHRSPKWLFPSRRIITHLPVETARNAFHQARNECGLAAKFRTALKKQKPDLLATLREPLWDRDWGSFSKLYGHGSDARHSFALPPGLCPPDLLT